MGNESVSHPAPSISADETAPQGKEPVGPPAGDPMLGRVIAGKFTVLGRLGAGAMGTVYRAKQARIGREVAIKILRSDRALDEASRGRFLREARANSLLTSPNTVTVFDFGADDRGDFYLAMELLEGESLGQRIRRKGRIDAAAAIDTACQALKSLSEAHAKGIVHRDLKPDNLFYARTRGQAEEIVKVLDFGVAKMIHADAELAMNAVETQAGTVFGTPRYMSPEQAQGRALDTRSDLYSLGVILYQMLTGRPPFTDDDAVVVMARHIKTPPRPMNESAPSANVPAEIEAVVMKALSKDPEQRPPTADAMAAELAHALELAGQAASPVSSGVRISIPPGVETAAAGPEGPRPGPTVPAAPASSLARAEDADVAMQVAALRPRRWPLVLASIVVAAAIAGVVRNESRTAHAPAPAVARLAVPAASAPASPEPPVTVTETPRPEIPSAGAAASPSATTTANVTTTSTTGAVATTASTATKDLRTPPPPTTPSPASKPASVTVHRGPIRGDGNTSSPSTSTTSNVGYGYLE
jgi:serine/threonine-protein kinase